MQTTQLKLEIGFDRKFVKCNQGSYTVFSLIFSEFSPTFANQKLIFPDLKDNILKDCNPQMPRQPANRLECVCDLNFFPNLTDLFNGMT